MNKNISYPSKEEYALFYEPYVGPLKDRNFFNLLAIQKDIWSSEIATLSDAEGLKKYAAEKWSVKEILQHLIDSERVFVYRAMCIARNEKQPLPGFDENDYVKASNADKTPLNAIVESYLALRASTELFFKQIDPSTLTNVGIASGSEVSVRALAYILVGHERHHLKVLKDLYKLNLNL